VAARPRSSLPSQIAAAQRAHGRLDGSSPPLLTEGLIALEQAYLDDVAHTLEWVAANAELLREFLAWRKGRPAQ